MPNQAMLMNVAKVTRWHDDHGLSFAKANGQEYFVHIKALGPVSRNPKVDDFIIITNAIKSDRGMKITMGILDGVPLKKISSFKNKSCLCYFTDIGANNHFGKMLLWQNRSK